MTGLGLQSLFAVVLVLGLVGALAFLARRGSFGSLTRRGPIVIETAAPLGERRQLVIVAVEGRRLLLGLTPASVAMITELQPPAPAPAQAPAFEQELKART
jgi:flagellar biogenesis protein FliO